MGSIVAAIQEKANAKGVLTQALKEMEIKLTAPTIEKKTVKVKVVQIVDKKAPKTLTKPPTKAPFKPEFSAASSVYPAFVSMVAMFVVSFACVFQAEQLDTLPQDVH